MLKLIEELVEWENINNNDVLNRANRKLKKLGRCCSDNRNHHEAKKLFNPDEILSS